MEQMQADVSARRSGRARLPRRWGFALAAGLACLTLVAGACGAWGYRESVRRQAREQQLAELRLRAEEPDADGAALWQELAALRAEDRRLAGDADLQTLHSKLLTRRDEEQARRAQRAYDDLLHAEGQGHDLAILLIQADRFLRDFAGSAPESDVRHRRDAYLLRIDERDIEVARQYSSANPLNFQTRREHYQRYLDRHPFGAFVQEAEAALQAIESDWDKQDFRLVRDHYHARAGDIPELTARCRSYLAAHPRGRYAESARDLLRWSEQVTMTCGYKVTLRRGHFERGVGHWLSRGPDLSVEIEVAGVRHGPSTIIANSHDPEWNYEFPRPVQWKLGDPVRIRVKDHDYRDRIVLDLVSDESDPLAINFLGNVVHAGGHRLIFESDFPLPVLPQIE